MQVFLPFSDFKTSLEVLDNKRLLKQLVEAKQIITGTGFSSHPITLAWQHFIPALRAYVEVGRHIWVRRGIETRGRAYSWSWDPEAPEVYELPPWVGLEPYHVSHATALLCKDPSHYTSRVAPAITASLMDVCEAADVPYLWPRLVAGDWVYQIGTGRGAPLLTRELLVDSCWQWVNLGKNR